ncbi:NADPH:quinone reductase [Blastococcus sp. SYSU DS0973]
MRAVWYSETGPAEKVLQHGELPDPVAGPGEVVVQVAYSGVNPSDWQARSGSRAPAAEGQIPHQDGSGYIVHVGEGVPENRIGERVWLYHAAYGRRFGTAAEYSCVPAHQAVRLPDSVPLLTGALIGIPLMTAHAAIRSGGDLRGRTVLVTGGAGAVGRAAVRWASLAGARVIATASTAAKQDLARRAGADVVLDYRADDVEAALEAASPDRIDLVVDVALGANLRTYVDRLARGARVVAYALLESDPTIPLAKLIRGSTTLEFLLVYNLDPADLAATGEAITTALQEDALFFPSAEVLPLDEAAAAHDKVQAGADGRVVLAVAPDDSDRTTSTAGATA